MSYAVEDYLVPAGAGTSSNTHLTLKIGSEKMGGDFSIMQGVMEPGDLLAPHTHDHEDQAVFVIDGELEFEIGGPDGLRFTAGPGSWVYKPRGVSHSFWNATSTPVPYVELSGRDGFQKWVRSHDGGNLKAAINGGRDFGMHMHFERIPVMLKQHGLKKLAGMEEPGPALKATVQMALAAVRALR